MCNFAKILLAESCAYKNEYVDMRKDTNKNS